MPRKQALRRVVMRTPGTFTAQYHGQCSNCEQPIVPGDSCRYNDDNEVVHAKDCDGYAKRLEERPAVICTTCWLTKPCGCDS